ncbi:MAG: thioredoxin family protein [Candidatus Izimaplasma sp.]|nr:thioredoxin family protein [Candidatus Izimaplasma bacterium]
MKKLLFLLTLLLVITLSACIPEGPKKDLDYSDFEEHLISSYSAAENDFENKYVVYYYGRYCGHCETIKPDLLDFFDTFETLPFYIFNINDALDFSNLEEFVGTPTLYVMSDGEVIESYVGSNNIPKFIAKYRELEFDYNMFTEQHLTAYQEVLDIENETYILYYYLETCPHSMEVKETVLTWAYTKSINDIYFMNGANVNDLNNIPTELTILNSGTPIIVIMSDGVFTGEYYSGSEEILEYILAIGDGKIKNLE